MKPCHIFHIQHPSLTNAFLNSDQISKQPALSACDFTTKPRPTSKNDQLNHLSCSEKSGTCGPVLCWRCRILPILYKEMIFQDYSRSFVHVSEGTQMIHPRATKPKTKHSPRGFLGVNPGFQRHVGAIRESGILVLRLEGPLFYANVGKPRSSQSGATHLMS